MSNQIVLVGSVAEELKETSTKDGKKEVSMILKVARPDKNFKKSNDFDYIKCILRNGFGENITKYCEVGSIVGIKGRVETSRIEDNGNVNIIMNVIPNRINYLSGKKEQN